jgi:hypothetical protein
MANKRKIIEFLPKYLQSDALSKVFSATVDHLFQPESVEFLSGYIGTKPEWYDSNTDFYITEPDNFRSWYQLAPTALSKNNQSNTLSSMMFYEDLLRQIKFQGGFTNNPDRLFEQEYYSWAPPIDIDKFVNYASYYWLPSGPGAIQLINETDLGRTCLGNPTYSYVGDVIFTSTGERNTFTQEDPLILSSGLILLPTNDLNSSYNNIEWAVEGVGTAIRLVPFNQNLLPAWDTKGWSIYGWDGDTSLETAEYCTIARGAIDGNTWSVNNRWFHKSILTQSRTTFYINSQAVRPIIEFVPGLVLWQYGTNDRGIVDVVSNNNTDLLSTIVGQKSATIQGITLKPGMRILSLNDFTPGSEGIIWKVSHSSLGTLELNVDTFGSETGSPSVGDRFTVRFGAYEGVNFYYMDGAWQQSPQQYAGTTAPLFQAFDIDGNSLSDPTVYPGSNFAGTKVFSYSTDPTQPIDEFIGIPIELDQYGDYVFCNNLATDQVGYISDGKAATYVGYLFVEANSKDTRGYYNSWNLAPNTSRQYIVNEYDITEQTSVFILDQSPAEQIDNTLPNITVEFVYEKTSYRLSSQEYQVEDTLLELNASPPVGARLIVRTWNPFGTGTKNGYYELPPNLTANPNNLNITTLSRSQFLTHFAGIIQNQTGFSGTAIGINNYRDTKKNIGLGTQLLQHRAPLLKLSLLNSNDINDLVSPASKTDPALAMQFARRSYTRFYNRFLNALFDIASRQGFTANSDPVVCDQYQTQEWINAALKQINVGKTKSSPWANSGIEGLPGSYGLYASTSPTFVPTTSTRLGIAPCFQPMVYYDTTYSTPQLTIQTHDGSRIVMVDSQGQSLGKIQHEKESTTNPEQLTNPVAAAWLQFELDIYANLPAEYKNIDTTLAFDLRTQLPGKWRKTSYSFKEIITLTRGFFDKWLVSNQIDFGKNTSYDALNPFTYNYRTVNDKEGQPIPGHWQGIYRWFYDTDRPHTCPWEMLGFSQKPIWWDSEYGAAPYTNGNTALWEDLRDGLIRQGERQGTHVEWQRPGLMSFIPVDSQGKLLPPDIIGCAGSIPSVHDAQDDWEFGDGSPIEMAWIYSQEYNFIIAQLGYLMKPAKFIEQTWDSLRTKDVYASFVGNQWIYVDSNSRRPSNSFYVHRENPSKVIGANFVPNESDLTYFGSAGFQHWISEYLVSQGLNVSTYLGNIIRGGDVQLAHRMAGYTNADSLRAVVDSYGQIGYSSQLIPTENIAVHLYRSTSTGINLYSGVIVEQVKEGWRINGYDVVGQTFTIIPSNVNGGKTNVVIGNQRATEYQEGLNTTKTVAYGTIFSSQQSVYDFLISYGRWLTAQGWVFETFNSDAGVISDWRQSAKEFLFWSQGNWQDGTFIALSPGAKGATFNASFGMIQYLNGDISGTYPVVDKSGAQITPQHIDVLRDDSGMTVQPNNTQGVYGLKLFTTTIEHVILFDNETSFGDVIYSPLYNLQQQRIKIYAYRVNDWNGRIDAPGYIVTQNTDKTWTITSNFDKTANDFRRYFNVEQPKNYTKMIGNQTYDSASELGAVDNETLSGLAKHLFGFQQRDWLKNLLLEDSNEFEFYQGFIRQKGTKNSLNGLLRNTSILPQDSSINLYEEWMIRIGTYGGKDINQFLEFFLSQDKIAGNPQWIRFFQAGSDNLYDNVLDIVPGDPNLLTGPRVPTNSVWKLRDSYLPVFGKDLPTAGYVQLGETQWYVLDTTQLLGLYNKQNLTSNPVQLNELVWQFVTDNQDWTVWRLVSPAFTIINVIPSNVSGDPTTFITDVPHGLLNDDICIINGVTGSPDINGTYQIFAVTPTSFQIEISTFTSGQGGNVLVYRKARFTDTFDRDSNEPPNGWQEGDLTYVDSYGENSTWSVFKYVNQKWILYRQQELKIDNSLIEKSSIIDALDDTVLATCVYFDPASGRIPADARAEIDYVADYDPAKYSNGDNSGTVIDSALYWTSEHIGEVWWDLSAVRYIDYEQGDEWYRVQNWGKIAPGTGITIYEWIRSPISPADWASYAAEGTTITVGSNSFIPTGTVRSPLNWSEGYEYDVTGTAIKYYYFWVGNSALSPSNPSHTLTTQGIANLIQDPSLTGLPWYAIISQNSMIIGNVSRLLNGNRVYQRIEYANQKNDQTIFSEWQLIREGDQFSPIAAQLWQKMKDSLVTFDGLNNDVPDYHLNTYRYLGNEIRPRQTWFMNRVAASKVFVDTINDLLSTSVTPLVYDPTKAGWLEYFTMAEDIPPQSGNWEYHVKDLAERDALIGAIAPGDRVLVDAVTATQNRWTIWQYQPLEKNVWNLIREQVYVTSNFWDYVDWYASGFNQFTQYSATVESILDLTAIENVVSGTVVKVLNGGDSKWQLWQYTTSWMLVGQQDGTVQISRDIYKWSDDFGGFDGLAFDSVGFDQTAAIEFANIIDGIKNAIYFSSNSIELNTLFFAMLNYVVSEQTNVDWLVKASSMVVTGFNQPLSITPILLPDNTENILGFLNEAKPYHAKIREFVTAKSTFDQSSIGVVDFDVPLPALTNGEHISTPADPSTIDTTNGDITSTSFHSTYKSWFDNYQTNPELIRNLKTTLIFDRICAPNIVPGWGDSWDSFAWSDGVHGNYGALSRIFDYYQPTPGMKPKIVADLISGSIYKGVTLNSIGFNIEAGWDRSPWGGPVGWDANTLIIEDYLDQIIHGGTPLDYDTAIGNGITKVFPVLKQSINPNNLIVWSDGKLRLYGVDWYVPTYAKKVEILQGGTGYSVGDQLNIVGGTNLVPTRIKVTNIANGKITGVEIIGQGSYSIVSTGPYVTEYPSAYPGNGKNAVFNIEWSCTDITFYNPPASSLTPNIYILHLGTTFGAAPQHISDTYHDGNSFVQPWVDDNHPEELFPLRPKDGLLMDVYTSANGGRPQVVQKIYELDGTMDQFDLGVLPQSDAAVMAFHNGKLLKVGLTNDFVINYATKKMVFIVPPAAGILNITSIGFGGSSRSVKAAYVVSGGHGYNINDIISVNADLAIVAPKFKVTEVNSVGGIISLEVIDIGLYSRLPPQPVNQSASSGVGTGVKLNLRFSDNFKLWTYIGDGNTTDYTIPGATPDSPGGILVTIDGVFVPWIRLSTGIRLYSPADYGAVINIATFDNALFSVVNETAFTITDPLIQTYSIGTPGNSMPAYITTDVLKNGKILTPPKIQQLMGNGSQKAWNLSIDITGSLQTQVYMDGKLLTPNTDYILAINTGNLDLSWTIEFTNVPKNNAFILIVVIDTKTNYIISGNSITFVGGLLKIDDEILVTVYSQDADYEFRTEEFVYNQQNVYDLAELPFDFDTIQVWVEDQLLIPNKDYLLIRVPAVEGWSTSGWDSSAWDVPIEEHLRIKITKQSTWGWSGEWDDEYGWDYLPIVTVRYMMGLPFRKAVQWRTLQSNAGTLSTVLNTARMSFLLQDVTPSSQSIEISDYSVISAPDFGKPGRIYINNECIEFTEMHVAPTVSYPKKAMLTGLSRDRFGTSGAPKNEYNVQFYDGNGEEIYFETEASIQSLATSVFANEKLLKQDVDYAFVQNPPGYPAGAYVKLLISPPYGPKAVKIVSLNQKSSLATCHDIGDNVLDAGTYLTIAGGYTWEPNKFGLQYGNSDMSRFILERS